MNFVLRLIRGFLEPAESPAPPAPTVTVQRQYLPQQFGRRGPCLIVQRARTPYWQECGWQQQDSDYVGAYHTRFGSWRGRITISPSGRIEVFVKNPPSALKRHPHWQCFRARDNGWYFVHPVTAVPDVSAGILSIEKTITEAHES